VRLCRAASLNDTPLEKSSNSDGVTPFGFIYEQKDRTQS
jgi:hypothetical protein